MPNYPGSKTKVIGRKWQTWENQSVEFIILTN